MKQWSSETKVHSKNHQYLLLSGVVWGDEMSCFSLASAWWSDLDVEYGGAIDLIIWNINPENIRTWDI